MAERRFGPTRGAGVVIVEKEAQKAIIAGALGSTAYTGILQKGPIRKPFPAFSSSDFRFRAGSFIPESLVPDCGFDFFKLGQGRGTLYLNRLTDGSEKISDLELRNRRSPKSSTLLFQAGNAGRWAGKKKTIVDNYASVTSTTATLSNVPVNLKKDELVGGKLKFNAVPGKSFDIIANTALGVLTVPSDVDLVAELNGNPDQLISVDLQNDGLAVGVLIKDGQDSPLDEWGLEIYLIEGGISTLVKQFPNLSSDPASANYFSKIINDDPNSDFLLKVVDLHVGSITADIRPANVFGESLALTDTVLIAKIHDEISSSVGGAKAKADPLTLGASVIPDEVTLEITTPGARANGALTFAANPTDGDTVVINGKTITFKNVVALPASQVLIGANAEGSLDNLKSFIASSSDPLLKDMVFSEKFSASVLNLFAQTAGLAGNSIATTSSGTTPPTFGAATLSGGVNQVWSYSSLKMPFLTGLSVISGVAFTAPNDFGVGFKVVDVTKDSTKNFALGDTLKLLANPLEVGKLVGGVLVPDVTDRRIKFKIVGNTANMITAKAGSNMTANAAVGDSFRVEYVQELGNGYDGIADIGDIHYVNAYDPDATPLKALRGNNLGLVKLATPGVTAVAVQKAGAALAEAQNWQYRYEVPASVVSEDAAEEFINDQLGRNDYAVVTWPSFAKVLNPNGNGLKLSSQTGAIHGLEARVANDFQGYHKAAAGIDVVLSNVVALPDGFQGKTINEEFLDPVGANFIKSKEGNFILWGDETVGTSGGRKFKHKREYLSHIENVFLENFDFIIFAINDEQSDKLLHSAFIQFFTPEFAKRAVRGKDLADAVRIKIDAENNTDLTRAEGNLNAELSLRIADTVKRFIITISELGVTESVEA